MVWDEIIYAPFKFSNVNHFIYLIEPRVFSHYCERCLQRVGPKLWNELPLEIKSSTTIDSFKACLKTYLFKLAFDIST